MGKVHQIKIGDLIIIHKKKKYSIDQYGYYQALVENNRKLYEKEVKKSRHQGIKKTGTWRGFLQLRDKILARGYQPSKSPILININKKPFVCHGRHRIVILMHVYGPELNLHYRVRNGVGEVVDISHQQSETVGLETICIGDFQMF